MNKEDWFFTMQEKLPHSWLEVKFTDITWLITCGVAKKPNYVEKGIPFLSAQNSKPFKANLNDIKYISEEDFKKFTVGGKPEKNDVLYSRVGAKFGEAAKVTFDFDFAIYVSLTLIKPIHSLVDSDYLVAFLNSIYGNIQAHGGIWGSGIQNLNVNRVRLYRIPLAPLNEQRRLVTKIEALKTRSQRVKDALSSIPALLEQFRQSVLAAAFSGALTADWRKKNPNVEPVKKVLIKSIQEESNILPDTWGLATVGDVIESLKYGTSQKCGYESVGMPVLRIPNIGNGVIEHFDLKYADLPKKEFDELRLVPGDILIIRSNGSVSLVGKSALVKESEKDFAYAGYLIRLRLNQLLIYPNYLNLCLSSHDIRMQIEVPAKSTSGVHNINSQEVKRLKIPVAPLEEQKEIVRQVQLLFKLADTIEQQYQQTFGAINQLDQSILAEAFRGALVPQDPNDEPALVLLERIRAEREKNISATSKRSKKSADTSPSQNNKNTGATSKRSNKSEPFKEAIQMELELE